MRLVENLQPKPTPDMVVRAEPVVKLSPRVKYVKVGTPLTAAEGGWEPCVDPAKIKVYSRSTAHGGQTVHVQRELVAEVKHLQFTPGEQLRITQVDDFGNITLESDEDGRILALDEQLLLMA